MVPKQTVGGVHSGSFSLIMYGCRTKWKRQNQLRLEQLRHQASVEKEILSVANMRKQSEQQVCCPSTLPVRYGAQSPCTFLSTAAAAIFHNVTYIQGCQL